VAFQGQPFRIPTIVPARQEDGSCVFYAGGLCSIHDIAPYGCAFFDNHMGDTEANHRSGIGLSAILADGCGGYGVLWQHLWDCGLRVPGPEVSRRKMDEEGDTAPGVNQHYNKTPIELKEEAA
jgi:Fe-S-cluster containining protein